MCLLWEATYEGYKMVKERLVWFTNRCYSSIVCNGRESQCSNVIINRLCYSFNYYAL